MRVVEDQRVPSKKLKLETLSEQDMKSRERAGGSLKDLFEFSDEVDYTSFLTDEALSPLYPSSPVTPTCSFTTSEPAGDDMVVLDTHLSGSPGRGTLCDAERLGDGKSMERFDEDFFLV